MRTKTKIPLTKLEINQIIEGVFSKPVHEIQELSDGMFNMAYRVEIQGYRPVFLKVAPPDGLPVMTYEHQLLKTEVRAQCLVREKTQFQSLRCCMQIFPGA